MLLVVLLVQLPPYIPPSSSHMVVWGAIGHVFCRFTVHCLALCKRIVTGNMKYHSTDCGYCLKLSKLFCTTASKVASEPQTTTMHWIVAQLYYTTKLAAPSIKSFLLL